MPGDGQKYIGGGGASAPKAPPLNPPLILRTELVMFLQITSWFINITTWIDDAYMYTCMSHHEDSSFTHQGVHGPYIWANCLTAVKRWYCGYSCNNSHYSAYALYWIIWIIATCIYFNKVSKFFYLHTLLRNGMCVPIFQITCHLWLTNVLNTYIIQRVSYKMFFIPLIINTIFASNKMKISWKNT